MTESAVVTRLKSQMRQGEVVLFVGAGFSLEAKDAAGNPLPTGRQLGEELWTIALPGTPYEAETRLADVYQAAKKRDRGKVAELLQRRLSVNAESLPESYGTWFAMPWAQCYTLNVDDLDLAVSRRFSSQRKMFSISATSGKVQGTQAPNHLEIVHLNGAIWDDLDEMTFSDLDYGARSGAPDQWYTKCVNDIVGRTVVFVGTGLHEPTLWQYLELRKRRGPARSTRELRPHSYLVMPQLNAARQLVLGELNVEWLPMTSEEFEQQVLRELGTAVDEGHDALRLKYLADARTSSPRLVSELSAAEPGEQTDYLLGQEPAWSDLKFGRAIVRDVDAEIHETASSILDGTNPRALVISGTAGSGKSTSLMRLALRLSGEGVPVYWLDSTSNVELHRVRDLIMQSEDPIALLVDDADTLGRTVTGWVREFPKIRPGVLLAIGLRSTKIDGLVDAETVGGADVREIFMPPLSDHEINDLIAVLDANNRLGILKGKPHVERVAAFKKHAHRQLLVAMIQATSGKDFRQKVIEEFTELQETQRFLYAAVCLVHSQRYDVTRNELLLAVGSASNATLNDLDTLVRRHLVTNETIQTGYKARHRVIADEVVGAMQERSYVGSVLEGVCFAFAQGINQSTPLTSRSRRRLIRFMNHEFVLGMTRKAETGRAIYGAIEQLLDWDYHFWLHRGALEVEVGDLSYATHFLDQSRSLMPDDPFVCAEYGYLLLKRAAQSPDHASARGWYAEGSSLLENLIEYDGKRNPHPYHILGSQGLAWTRRAPLGEREKRDTLRRLTDMLEGGIRNHPRRQELATLATDLKRELLLTAVNEKDSK